MSSEIIALIEEPQLLIAVLLVGVFAGTIVEKFLSKMQRRTWRARNSSHWDTKRDGASVAAGTWSSKRDQQAMKPPDAAEQLRIVMGARFSIKPLLNKSEARVFKELDGIVVGCNSSWQVMAQVSLGEILRSKDADAYRCINSKRVDFLLVDGECVPRHAIEYHGGGHHQGTAAARDAIKKEALRRAGIGYHEVVSGQTTPAELRRLVETLIEKPGMPE